MKKQILFLTFLVLAALASVNNAFGQPYAMNGSAPRGVACEDDELHPIAGKFYTYEVSTNPATGNEITWWATKDPNFITTSGTARTYNTATALTTADGDLIATSGNYANSATDATTVAITWTDAILSNTVYQGTPSTTEPSPTFVVAYVSGACSDNLKVFEINPIEAFTVDIRNIDNETLGSLDYDTETDQCIDDVSSATYVSGAMQYEYGWNTFVYEVIAANFSNYYTPIFNLSGLGDTQTAVIEWTTSAPADWATATWVPYDQTETDVTALPRVNVETTTNTSIGVSIYVRVTVTNNQFENNANDLPNGIDITLAVDGVNSVGTYDVNNWIESATPGTYELACAPTTAPDQADTAVQTLLPRPAVTEGTTSAIGNPGGLIPGDETNTITTP
ncbi:hypothetical protein [Gaoshiqia sp. Z1-71]|uniref:hypothetical protein n=1 Tax=Gaoshiqia hydrogeniformans TaxID=3290090 RepID=UPI003BF8EF4B